jgi:hypothetical protein
MRLDFALVARGHTPFRDTNDWLPSSLPRERFLGEICAVSKAFCCSERTSSGCRKGRVRAAAREPPHIPWGFGRRQKPASTQTKPPSSRLSCGDLLAYSYNKLVLYVHSGNCPNPRSSILRGNRNAVMYWSRTAEFSDYALVRFTDCRD